MKDCADCKIEREIAQLLYDKLKTIHMRKARVIAKVIIYLTHGLDSAKMPL